MPLAQPVEKPRRHSTNAIVGMDREETLFKKCVQAPQPFRSLNITEP